MGESTLISKISTTEKFMALTFDAGSDSANTASILNILTKYNAKSTFFSTGSYADEFPESLVSILEKGHEIGNHSYSHPDMTQISESEMKSEIRNCENVIINATGVSPVPLFRPPFGEYNQALLNVAGNLDYPWTIMWTIDTIDWNGTPASTMISKVLNNAEPGAIVLMHVGSGTHTVEALPSIIQGLISKGYTLTTLTKMLSNPISDAPSVIYQAHVQNTGWLNWVEDGTIAGTTGNSLRAEAFKIKLLNAPAGLKIKYKVHVQNIGWQDWVYDGAVAGTTGKSLQAEAIQIVLEGTDADKYSVQYQAHVAYQGWLDWVKDGAIAGTTGKALRMEALRIIIAKKVPSVIYQAHVQDMGWLNWVKDGAIAGTEGQNLRAEAFKIQLLNAIVGLKIKYKVHVQNIGWQDWVYDGEVAGTTGESLRAEAIQIILEGTDADKLSVQYQAYVENKGWQQWVKDGAIAGTTGNSLKMEALKIQIVTK